MDITTRENNAICDEPLDADFISPPNTEIIMHNVQDLTVRGLTNLCSNYGAVVSAKKHKTNPNIAFVKFATESDATMAIQQLNSKLGFGYRAEFVFEKRPMPHIKTTGNPVLLSDGEDWDKRNLRRRFNYSLLPPLLINFPERKLLSTKDNYFAKTAGRPQLRKVDPELFFSIQKVSAGAIVATMAPGTSDEAYRQKRHDDYSKTTAGGQYVADRNEFTHAGLSADELATFGPIQYCVVCGGLGFVYCAKCGIYYCSTVHQRLHLAKHDALCTVRKDDPTGKPIESLESSFPPTSAAGGASVLTRDPLPNKVNVYITAVLTPDRIFVRSADRATEREYFQTLADCERIGVTARTALEMGMKLAVGEIYLVSGAPSGSYGRVLLIELGPEESKCVFMEYGTIAFVCNGSLRPIFDEDLKYRKVQVYKLCLANVTDEVGNVEKALEYLTKLKQVPLELKYRSEAGNMVEVQLRTPRGTSVNETVNRLIIIPPIVADQQNPETYIMYKDIPQTVPAYGNDRSIMILNRTTIQFDARVTWIAQDDLCYLEDLQEKLQHYGAKVSQFVRSFTPRIGELCLVRCLDRWYRAVCHETAGDSKPAVFLCDYGCMMIVDLADIRKIPAPFATEVRTHDGIVRGLAEAKATGMKLDSEFLDIYLPENEILAADISQELRQESLIAGDVPESFNILNLHVFSEFLASIQRSNK